MGGKVEGVRSLLQYLVARTLAGVLQKVEQWQRGESA